MEPSLSPNFIERGGTTWCIYIYRHTYHFYSRHYQLHPQVIHRIKYDLWTVNTLYFTSIYTTYISTRPICSLSNSLWPSVFGPEKRSSPEVSNPKEWLGWFFGRLGNSFVGCCLKPASQWEKKIIITHYYMGVSENSGTPKSSILIGFSIINHPFWGTPIFETPIYVIRDFDLSILGALPKKYPPHPFP